MNEYHLKYLKYKSKYINLIGGFKPENYNEKLYWFLFNQFMKDTIYSTCLPKLGKCDDPQKGDDYRIYDTLKCALDQIIDYNLIKNIIDELKTGTYKNVILIDGMNLMRNEWFIKLTSIIMDKQWANYIDDSIKKYINRQSVNNTFENEINLFYNTIKQIFNIIDKNNEQNLILIFVQKPLDQKLSNFQSINTNIKYNKIMWIPFDCYTDYPTKTLCINNDKYVSKKNEADDYALTIIYSYLTKILHLENVYVISGDAYDWYKQNEKIKRLIFELSIGFNNKSVYIKLINKDTPLYTQLIHYNIYNQNINLSRNFNTNNYWKLYNNAINQYLNINN